MKAILCCIAALAVAGCNGNFALKPSVQKSDRIPQAIVKDGRVYQFLSGEYVEIPISQNVSKESASRTFSTEVGSKLATSIEFFYAYGKVHYKVTFKLKDKNKKSLKAASDELASEYIKSEPYSLKLMENGFNVEEIPLIPATLVVESYTADGQALAGSYEAGGSFPIGPTKFENIDSASVTWR
jgi:predicted nuclease of restriction endonuclease-like (RecB) superfamily